MHHARCWVYAQGYVRIRTAGRFPSSHEIWPFPSPGHQVQGALDALGTGEVGNYGNDLRQSLLWKAWMVT